MLVVSINLGQVLAGIIFGTLVVLAAIGVLQLIDRDALERVQGDQPTGTFDSAGVATDAIVEQSPTTTPARREPHTACDPQAAVQETRRSVVRIQSTGGMGTGFIVETGQVLTNAHVVGSDSRVAVTLVDGSVVTGRIQALDAYRDLALIAIEQTALPSAILSEEPSLAPGTKLWAWGYAEDLPGEPSLTSGTFSGNRSITGVNHVQTDTALNPGNSGGPLFTDCGSVVGIVVGGFREAEGLNFAVSAAEAIAFMASGVATVRANVETLSPAETVALFYSLLDQQAYEQAFGLLSPAYKGSMALQTFINGYITTQSITVEEVRETGPAAVHATLLAADLIDGRALVRRFEGNWDLIMEGGQWKLNHGQFVVVSSSEVAQVPNYAGLWRITDTVTTGSGLGQTFTFDIVIYQSGDQLIGLSDTLVLEGYVAGNRIQMSFFQIGLPYEGSFDWMMSSTSSGLGTFVSSSPNSGSSSIQRFQ